MHTGDPQRLLLGDLLSDLEDPDEAVAYVEIGRNLFRQVDGEMLLAFEENARGDITHLYFRGPTASFTRIAWYETMHVLAAVALVGSLVFVRAGYRSVRSIIGRARVRESAGGRLVPAMQAGFCLANVVFAGCFVAMLLTSDDPFRYPPGTRALLALPVLSLGLTAAAAVAAGLAWVRRRGTVGSRVRDTLVVATSGVFLWFLDMWNMLGWDL